MEEQQEKLRRFVDDWRGCVWEKLEQHDGNFIAATKDTGNINDDPIVLVTKYHEVASALDLVNTDNILFNKLMIVLAHDCFECVHFRREAAEKYFPPLLVFGLRVGLDQVPAEGELQKTFANSFSFFQNLLDFLSKLKALLLNLVQQLEAIYAGDGSRNENNLYSSFWNVHLQTAVVCLAEGFSVLLTVDQIMVQNGGVGHSLSLFTRMLQTVRTEPSKFGMEAQQVESLDQAISDIESTLMGGVFQRCLLETFYENPEMNKLKKNRQCLDEISLLAREALQQIFSRLETVKEQPCDRDRVAGLLAVWVCQSWMCGEAPEKKLVKAVLEVHRRSPLLHLFCNTRFIPLEFLVAHLPPWALALPSIKEARTTYGANNVSYLASLDEVINRDAYSLKVQLSNWLISFDSTISPVVQKLAIHAVLGTRLKQHAQGVFLANRLRHILRATIDLHSLLEVPIGKDQLKSLCHVAELLKAVEGMFHRRSSESALGIGHMTELAQAQIERRLVPLRSQLEADLLANSRSSSFNMLTRSFTRIKKDVDIALLDSLAAVNLALTMVQGSASIQKCIILRLALDVLSNSSRLPEETAVELMDLCVLVELVADLHHIVRVVTDCSFLYWSRETMPSCLGMLYAQAGEARHLQLVLNAFKDAIKLLKVGNAEQVVIDSYEKEMEDAISNELVIPLCRDIETDLRLHVHSAHLKGAVSINPTKTGVRDLSWFVQLKPVRMASKFIHIKTRVENYLIAAFYDHSAVALHNWRTYGEMRHLAELKYGLDLDDIHLPGQTVEQGVDVLEIMRNIHIFVACYTYNLNTQVFIERVSNAHNRKYLNSINVRHVANSIRTHGTGIMSTTVNFAYQFLAQKFVVFSQFLFDDHIKSRLIKEHQFYKESREKGVKDYPVTRAQKLNIDIRKLGLTDDGLSFLDQFRRLIAEMGNALGFVRMVRLGGLHYCSTASGFIRGRGKAAKFEETARSTGMSIGAIHAGKLLDQAVESQRMPIDSMDYLNILTKVFSQELRSRDNLHLKEFFLILPALTINAVEAMLQSRERLHKRARDGGNAMFTDDGFALGLAYILKVLGQDREFDSLHWFESAKHHFGAEKARLEDGLDMDSIAGGMSGLQIWSQKLASISEEEAQNMQLVVKRISNYLMELELVDFTFSGARIFFY